MEGKEKVVVTQVRSSANRTQRVKDTLGAMGLGRVGKSKELPVDQAVVGMIKKVRHLLDVKAL